MATNNEREAFRDIKTAARVGDYTKAFTELCALARHTDDFSLQWRYATIYNSIPADSLDLTKLRVAILGTSTTDHFIEVFRFYLAKQGFESEIFQSQFDTIQQTVLDTENEFYRFNPEIVWFFTNYRDVTCNVSPSATLEEVERTVIEAVGIYIDLWNAVQKNTSAHIIQNNADLPSVRSLGNYEGMVPWGRANILKRFNLMLPSVAPPGVTIFDLDHLASHFGKAKWHDQRFWYHSKHAFAFDAVGMTAFHGAMLVRAIKGRARKCIVVDLDNTLWGGVIGDDGLDGIVLGSGPEGEAFVDFQNYLLELKSRGVILAVCSKNDEETAREPFLLHADMKMSLEDIAVFKANWRNKADNIIEIKEALNIGTDSIVFIDDDPAERDLVRRFLPEVAVPEMPSDPTEYLQALDREGFFGAITFSEEDRIRTDLYREDANRREFKETFTDLSEYLQSLDMEATVSHFDSFHLPRITQIINKSNQFHLTNKRCNETEIKSIQSDPRFHCRFFKLRDKFGDNGLIAVVMLCVQEDGSLLVELWVMSCRVLSRGMEEFICAEIVKIGKQLGCGKIVGKYVPTKKNGLVSDLYKRLQFSPAEKKDDAEYWKLDLRGDLPEYKTFIRLRQNTL